MTTARNTIADGGDRLGIATVESTDRALLISVTSVTVMEKMCGTTTPVNKMVPGLEPRSLHEYYVRLMV